MATSCADKIGCILIIARSGGDGNTAEKQQKNNISLNRLKPLDIRHFRW